MAEDDVRRYMAAMHAVQTGVAFLMNFDPAEVDPKHLRVGVNSALLNVGAVAKLLVDKGVITTDEYEAAIAEAAEAEAERYRERIQARYGTDGTKIHLE
jgi:hypothetical protein